MPRQRHRQLAGGDAAAVVAHPHQRDAAALDVDLDARRAGIERVLDQLLDDRGRPFDHLAGGDLVDELAGKNADRKEHTSELQSPCNLVCRLLLEKKKKNEQKVYTGTTW